MTGSIMLIGAWLLIHHHCCATNHNEKSRNSFLIEQLSRRSDLEKNFIRYGRSLGTNIENEKQSISSRGGRGSDYMRLGRSSTLRDAEEKRGIPVRTGRDLDFIRFGRSMPVSNEDQDMFSSSALGEDVIGFEPLGGIVGEENQPLDGSLDNSDDIRVRLGITPAIGNEKRQYSFHPNHKMRFGRSGDSHAIQERANRNSNFMRFGRAKGVETRANRDMNFMRFGRIPYTDDKSTMCSRVLRSQDFMRFGRASTNNEETSNEGTKNDYNHFDKFLKCQESVSDTIDKRGLKLNSPSFIRYGRSGEQITMDRPNRAKDFMRFGRASSLGDDTEVRETRAGRVSDYMRFGRSQVAMEEEQKRGLQPRASQDFMRFGRASGESSNEKSKDIQTRSGHKSGFIRFGRTPNAERYKQKNGIQMRSSQGFIRFGRSEKSEAEEYGERLARIGRTLPSPFQPGFILGPELSFLPALPPAEPDRTSTDSNRFSG